MTDARTCPGDGSEHSHPVGERRHGEAGRVSAYSRKPVGWRGARVRQPHGFVPRKHAPQLVWAAFIRLRVLQSGGRGGDPAGDGTQQRKRAGDSYVVSWLCIHWVSHWVPVWPCPSTIKDVYEPWTLLAMKLA